MLHYLLRRIGYGLLLLWGVATLVFLLFHVLPGNATRIGSGQHNHKATLASSRQAGHPERPLLERYGIYLNRISPIGATYTNRHAEAPDGLHITRFGDSSFLSLKQPYLGRSYSTNRQVSAVLGAGLPGTLMLALSAMLIALIFGVGLGVLAALKKGTAFDTGAIAVSVAGMSVPVFFAALVLAYAFGSLIGSFTGLDMSGSLYEQSATGGRRLAIRNLIIPAIALSIRPMAIIIRHTRSAMLEALSGDHIRTAYAKGLSRMRVLLRHALPNALRSILAAIPGWLPELLTGSFFVEYVFGWEGIGKITVDAMERSDFPLVMGAVLLTALIFIIMNLVVELTHRLLHPRLRR